MKIVDVALHPLFHSLAEPYGDANGMKYYRTLFLIKIKTESGLTGWGECTDWLPTLTLGFEQRIVPYLLGKQATDRAQLVHHIKKWHGRAAACVSMALTEIAAKKAGMSVCELWGGRLREVVPVYASFQSYSEQVNWMKRSLGQVERALSDGFQQIKVKVGGKRFVEDREHILQVQALLAERGELILDANESYDLGTASSWERDFASWDNVGWFEEPIPLDQIDQYRLLCSRLSVPVAGGENLKSAVDFLPLLRAGALHIAQPDPAHEAGVEEYRHTLQLSRTYGLRVSPHTFDGALSRLYALFGQACLPPWSKMEGQAIEPVEWDVMENPFSMLIPLQPTDGNVTVPTGIGIGVELDENLLAKYRWDEASYS